MSFRKAEYKMPSLHFVLLSMVDMFRHLNTTLQMLRISFPFCLSVCWFLLAANVSGLCEGAELEVQMFSFAQMFIGIPNVQFSNEPAFLQNPCCAIVNYFSVYSHSKAKP